MRRPLRLLSWAITIVATCSVVTSLYFYPQLPSYIQDLLPTILGLYGVVLGSTLTIELQLYSGLLDRNHQAEMNRLEREQQLRMAAVDKRLEAHQEAYAILYGLAVSQVPEFLGDYLYSDEAGILSGEYNKRLMLDLCNRWYISKCFYLDAKAESAFRAALSDVSKIKDAQTLLRSTVFLPAISS